MILTQRLQIQCSEQRSRLAELAGLDELTPEHRAELGTLGTTHQDTEAQLRAAIAADGDPTQNGDPTVDPEVRERLELRGRTSFGRYLVAALTGQQITDVEQWSDTGEDFEASPYIRRPLGAILVPSGGAYRIVARVLPIAHNPTVIGEAVARLFAYREAYKPRRNTSDLSDGNAPSIAGAMLRSGAAELLRFSRTPGV